MELSHRVTSSQRTQWHSYALASHSPCFSFRQQNEIYNETMLDFPCVFPFFMHCMLIFIRNYMILLVKTPQWGSLLTDDKKGECALHIDGVDLAVYAFEFNAVWIPQIRSYLCANHFISFSDSWHRLTYECDSDNGFCANKNTKWSSKRIGNCIYITSRSSEYELHYRICSLMTTKATSLGN